MKGMVNVEFVLSVVVFITTIAFVTMMIINNIPFLHQESVIEHLRTKTYQVSELLLFDEGIPKNWNADNVVRIGLSDGEPYNLSMSKIVQLNAMCAGDYRKVRQMLGERALYVNINITNMETGQVFDNCVNDTSGLKFSVTRYAVSDSPNGMDLTRIEVTAITK